MGFNQRLFKEATVYRKAQASDGYGGICPTETEVISSYKFHIFNMNSWDREAMITQYGAEPLAVMMKGTGEYNSELANLDILQVSETERWRVMSVSEQYGRSSTPHHVSLVLMDAGVLQEADG